MFLELILSKGKIKCGKPIKTWRGGKKNNRGTTKKAIKTNCTGQGSLEGWTGDFSSIRSQMSPKCLTASNILLKFGQLLNQYLQAPVTVCYHIHVSWKTKFLQTKLVYYINNGKWLTTFLTLRKSCPLI